MVESWSNSSSRRWSSARVQACDALQCGATRARDARTDSMVPRRQFSRSGMHLCDCSAAVRGAHTLRAASYAASSLSVTLCIAGDVHSGLERRKGTVCDAVCTFSECCGAIKFASQNLRHGQLGFSRARFLILTAHPRSRHKPPTTPRALRAVRIQTRTRSSKLPALAHRCQSAPKQRNNEAHRICPRLRRRGGPGL